MRKIAFRAWDDRNKLMIQNIFSVTKSGCPDLPYPLIPPDTIWMQFTGLLDKSGKEIWEGDVVGVVVKQTGHGGHDFIKSVVEYKNGRFQANFWTDGSTWVEVLGNVWEHPHLLEKP